MGYNFRAWDFGIGRVPAIAEATYRIGVPIVVLEILLGVTIEPHGLGWAAPDATF